MYEDIFTKIRNEAKKRNLKENTINAYCNSVDYFLRTVDKDVSALTTDDVNAFLTEKRLGGLAPRTYNHYHSSIRFFYKRILKMNWEDEDIPRMKLDYSLPTVLSRDEMQSIIDHTSNLKHKAIIATMYSSGLRVSEVVHLHYDDISRTNKTIHVRESKSRRDRYTILSDRNLDLLTEYWFKCGKPRDILFPSSWTGTYLDKNSINQYFKKVQKKPTLLKRSPVIAADTALPAICLRMVLTLNTSRHCLDIWIQNRQKSKSMSATRAFLESAVLMTCLKAVKHERRLYNSGCVQSLLS